MFKEYIGDGVYVEYDNIGEGIWLTTENGIKITNRIFLETSTWKNLDDYVLALPKKLKQQQAECK